MQAVFIANWKQTDATHRAPDLPDLEYIDADSNLAGGYSCIGNVPQTETMLVLVDCSDAQYLTLKNGTDILWIEDVEEAPNA